MRVPLGSAEAGNRIMINWAFRSSNRLMIRSLAEHLPPDAAHTRPEGGMFLWVTLPNGASSMELFHLALQDRVAFLPDTPFYTDGRETSTLRLNFSCVDEVTIDRGVERLGKALVKLLQRHR